MDAESTGGHETASPVLSDSSKSYVPLTPK
jgi:hypothetical protein